MNNTVVVVGKCRTGKTYLLEKAFSNQITGPFFSSSRFDQEGLLPFFIKSGPNVPSLGVTVIDDTEMFEIKSLQEILILYLPV